MYITDCQTFVELRFFSRLAIKDLIANIISLGIGEHSFAVFYSPISIGKVVVIFRADFSPEQLAQNISRLQKLIES